MFILFFSANICLVIKVGREEIIFIVAVKLIVITLQICLHSEKCLLFNFFPDICQGKWIHWFIICPMKIQGMFRILRLEGCRNKSESCERYPVFQKCLPNSGMCSE